MWRRRSSISLGQAPRWSPATRCSWMADSWRSKEAFQQLILRLPDRNPIRPAGVLPAGSRALSSPSQEDPMKRHVILAGIAGTVLAAASASSAVAQASNVPDAAYCSQLSDAELVAC